MQMTIADRIAKDPPYKLLALDGGGIRGVMTLEVLCALQGKLQLELGRDDRFVLADYFDYIAGTSTGAIIATFLSLGWRAEKILEFYVDAGPAMFTKASVLRRFRYKFEDDNLAHMLQEQMGADTHLGSDTLRTLLMLVMRNATTDSPWPVSNNPHAKYNDETRPDNNRKLPLWQLVRASTAAPTYFPPETIVLGPRRFIFVDGGVTMYNNPAFQLFLMATLAPYRLCWPVGQSSMLLVSIGTGSAANANEDLAAGDLNLLYNAESIPSALMYAAANEQDLLCRVFGETRRGAMLDREIGDLKSKQEPFPVGRLPWPVQPKLFTYMRYDADLSRDGLTALGLSGITPAHVQQLDSVDHIDELKAVGKAVAAKQLDVADFAGFLG
jgi:patatin-like phospholipase/acyl hydrolase